MRILLIGEYSNVHWTLAQALKDLGHEVDVLSNDNLWQNNQNYQSLMEEHSTHWGIFKYTFNLLKALPQLRGYDVVQLINPYFFDLKAELLLYVYQYLRKNNKKIFLGGYANDYYWTSACLSNKALRYSEFYANGVYRDTIDNRMTIVNWMHGFKGKLNRIIANDCNGIITGLYESYIAYQPRFPEKTIYIPYPMDIYPHPQIPPPNINKLKFYITMLYRHEDLRGKDKMYSALYTLQYKRSSECDIIKTDSTFYEEYDHIMDGCDIMLDQLYSYSPSLKALQAMSKGIVVVGGGEEEHYQLVGEKELRPIVNVRPEGSDLYDKLEYLLNNKSQIAKLSAEGVSYIQKHHCPIKVAQQCLEFWEKK